MNIGLIGAGRIGQSHAAILAGLDGVDGLLVVDVVARPAEALASSLAGATTASFDEAFARADAVVIATPSDTHADLLMRAAEARLPAFCEKPIAIDLERTRRAVAAVDAAGIPVQMGFQRRYDPGIRAIRERVADGTLGTPYLIRSQTHDPEPPPPDYIAHSGGIFRDCLIHDLDAVRYVSGQEVVAVQAAGAATGFPEIGAQGDIGTATAILELSGGTIAQISALRHDPVGYDVRLEAFGSRDALAAGWGARTPIHPTDPDSPPPENPVRTFFDRFEPAYRAELEAFVRVVAGTEKPLSNHHDALEALRAAAACDLALAESRRVLLEEVA